MDGIIVLEVGRQAILVLLKISLPIMLVALIVGLTVSLFQALTQIQEMTLSFVPKIIAIFLSMIIFMPFISSELASFTHSLHDLIVKPASP